MGKNSQSEPLRILDSLEEEDMRLFRSIIPLLSLMLVIPARAQTLPAEHYVWKNVKVVAGGFITGIVFSPVEAGLAYVRTDIGGAYRFSRDAGQWIPLTDWVGPRAANFMGVESIALDPRDANKLYLALGTYSRGPAAIARSNDRGRTFQITEVPIGMGGNENGRGMGERLSVDPSDSRVLFFGSRRDGLWRSGDAGATWSRVESFPIAAGAAAAQRAGAGGPGGAPGIPWIVFDAGSEQPANAPTRTIFAGVAAGAAATLYRSEDAGKSWQAVEGAPPAGPNMAHHAALGSASHTLYITYNNGPGPNDITQGSVWKYQIDQQRWTNITPPSDKAGGYSAIALDPHYPGALLVSTADQWSLPDDLFRSTDDGKTWKRVSDSAQLDPSLSPYLYWGQQRPRFGWWIAALAIDPFDSNHALYGTGATIWGTHDLLGLERVPPATHWSIQADGIEETAVLALISPPAGPHLISGVGDIGGFTHEDLTVSPAAGMHSNPIFTNTTSLDFADLKPSVIVRTGTASRGGATAAISGDSGKTWRPLTLPAARANVQGRGGGNQGPYLVLSSDAATLLTANETGAFFSADAGASWNASTGLFANARPIADRAAAGTFYALDLTNRRIYTSTDGGASFSSRDCLRPPPAPAGRGLGNAAVRLKSSRLRRGDLFLLAGGALYRSNDAGVSFSVMTSNININNFALGPPPPSAVHHDDPSLLVTATFEGSAGIYRSDDLGNSWLRINDDAHQFGPTPTVITADPRIWGRVYIGMNGRGILYGEPAAQ